MDVVFTPEAEAGAAALSPPAAKAAFDRWRAVITDHDMGKLAAISREDAVFRSPMAHTPYPGRDALVLALSTVAQVFDDFTYHRVFATPDGLNLTLEFSAKVGDRSLKGIDMIRFDEDGMIAEFEVMVRPMSGLAALGEEMGKRLGGLMKAHAASGGAA